MKKSVVLTVK